MIIRFHFKLKIHRRIKRCGKINVGARKTIEKSFTSIHLLNQENDNSPIINFAAYLNQHLGLDREKKLTEKLQLQSDVFQCCDPKPYALLCIKMQL